MSDLLASLLERQRDVRPIHRFSRAHDEGLPPGTRWRDRLPLTKPGPDEQYAFEVNLDACTGCKACVTACHNLNGLADGETWRAVGQLHGGSAAAPFVQNVTSACHHCLDPACLNGCPVDAYEKDPLTGIVRHHDDQCIGCRYCTLTCPYEVPQFDVVRGIVRKCDMCHQRLAVGEAPACVQACPNGAITITSVRRDTVLADNEAGGFLPGAPDPGLTQPTTVYKSSLPLPRNALPADYYQVRPAHGHRSLVAMLVGTQLAVGVFAASLIGRAVAPGPAWALAPWLGLAAAVLALVASLFHLGRPHLAYRAIRGVGHSWLSREILAFGGFAGLASAFTLAGVIDLHIPGLGVAVVATGLAAVGTSVMVYVATRRDCWRADVVALRFYGTVALLGAAVTMIPAGARGLAIAVIATASLGIALDLLLLASIRDRRHGPFRRRAALLLGPLLKLQAIRLVALVIAIGAALVYLVHAHVALAALLLAAAVVAEVVERHLFFVAAAAPRMPGGVP
jgi:Fe-S-cluster-containing dehydrogenase component/DMSO reductase anchor subunit